MNSTNLKKFLLQKQISMTSKNILMKENNLKFVVFYLNYIIGRYIHFDS